jgi:hypothetical protein
MGRTSNKVQEYRTKGKGAYKGYWGVVELRDVLWHIYLNHKRWGSAWYEAVREQSYEVAIEILQHTAQGESMVEAIDIINRIIDIEMEG